LLDPLEASGVSNRGMGEPGRFSRPEPGQGVCTRPVHPRRLDDRAAPCRSSLLATCLRVLECAEVCSETNNESDAADAMKQSEQTTPAWGAGSEAAELPNLHSSQPAHVRGDHMALQEAWVALGRGEDYQSPPDFTDPRRPGRAQKAQAAWFKREWQRLERARAHAGDEAERQPLAEPAADNQPMPDLAALSVSQLGLYTTAGNDENATAAVPPPQAEPPPLQAMPPPHAPPPPLAQGTWARLVDLAAKPSLNGSLVRLVATAYRLYSYV